MMYRLIFALTLFCFTASAQTNQFFNPQCDVDSIGNLWVFTVDKSGSMLSERIAYANHHWSPQRIKNDVITRLSREGGILDQIDYTRDYVTLIETGYGTEEFHSYGDGFRAAESLDSSFIHIEKTFLKFSTNKKSGLESVLSDMLCQSDYKYQQSFVSQIRVLSLHRLVKLIQEYEFGLRFNKIYIVTITDDADVNDQWRNDYYFIKLDPNKMQELNNLHSRYVFSSFTQKGAGNFNELREFTDLSSKNHIYMYEYVTRQQTTNDIKCKDDSIITLSPLDGNAFSMQLNMRQIVSDSICFIYVDTVSVNGERYPICRYLNDTLYLMQEYDMASIKNDIVISGKIQVQYWDSIYGTHYKNYAFVQHNKDYTSSVHSVIDGVTITFIALVFALLFYVLLILPNRLVMKVYTPDGSMMRVRRGYRWQWEKLTPLACYTQNLSLFAKHKCFSRGKNTAMSYDSLDGIIIDSPVPLVVTKNVLSDSSRNNISSNAENSCGMYPDVIVKMYEETLAGRVSNLSNSRFKWVRRKLYPFINRFLFSITPHYYYWGDAMQGLISSPILDCSNLLLEFNDKNGRFTSDDKWLNMYYEGDYPVAEVLVCTQRHGNDVVWDVYQLCNRKINGYGISSAKHLIHFLQEDTDVSLIAGIRKQLEKAIRNELKVSKILYLDSLDNLYRDRWVHFNIQEATCMAYVCLVECTLEEKCQVLYSPFTDSDIEEKNVVIAPSAVSRLIWTSLVPFASKKKRPSGNIAAYESLDIVREGPACQKLLSLKNRRIVFDNINIKPQKTR